MLEQGGIYQIKLYENVGIAYNWPDNTNEHEVDSITNTGDEITLSVCGNTFGLESEFVPGQGINLTKDHAITFFIHEYTDNTLDLLQQLVDTVYGWVVEMTFFDGRVFIIPAPMVITGFDGVDSSENESFSIDMGVFVNTKSDILEHV